MKIFLMLAMSTLFFAKAEAFFNWDACYQLYMPNSMFPVVCLSGTNEEGIGGSNARLVMFHTNTDRVTACASSTTLRMPEDSLEFMLGSRKELVLSQVKVVNGRMEGKATFGQTQLNFLQLSPDHSKQLLEKSAASQSCQNLQPGKIIRIP